MYERLWLNNGDKFTAEYVEHIEEGISNLDAMSIESPEYQGCYYRLVNGEAEWINPPLVLDEIYRTTERYAGAPVYIIRTEYSSLPSSATYLSKWLIPYGSGISVRTIDYWAMIKPIDGFNYTRLPMISSDGSKVAAWCWTQSKPETGGLATIIHTSGDYSNYNGFFTVKFVYQDDLPQQ